MGRQGSFFEPLYIHGVQGIANYCSEQTFGLFLLSTKFMSRSEVEDLKQWTGFEGRYMFGEEPWICSELAV